MTSSRVISRRLFVVAGLTFFLGLWALGDAVAHKYFAIITRISDNPRAQTVEVIHRFFIHDILRALEDMSGQFVSLDDFVVTEELLGEYVEQTFSLEFDGATIELSYLGMQVEGNFIWTYFEAPLGEIPEIIEITNQMLTQEFDGQINTVTMVFTGQPVRSLNFSSEQEWFRLELVVPSIDSSGFVNHQAGGCHSDA